MPTPASGAVNERLTRLADARVQAIAPAVPETCGDMRLLDVLIAILVLLGIAVATQVASRRDIREGVAFAVDGDTLDLGGERVRISGIDAPELRQDCVRDRRSWACGEAARRALEEVLRSGPVTCAAAAYRDKYGRPLVRCTVGGADIGEAMVREGFAVAYRGRDYAGVQAEAQAARRGIWASTFQPPAEYRAAHPRTP